MLWLDTDAAIELASIDLLHSLPVVYDIAPATVYYLAELEYKVRGNDLRLFRKYPGAVWANVANFLKVASLGTVVDESKVASISTIHRIEEEAFLFAGALETKDSLVLTGDLSAIRAFAANGDALDVQALNGRIVITEAALLRYIEVLNWDDVFPRLQKGHTRHREIQVAIEEGINSVDPMNAVIASLTQSVNAVSNEVKPLLWNGP